MFSFSKWPLCLNCILFFLLIVILIVIGRQSHTNYIFLEKAKLFEIFIEIIVDKFLAFVKFDVGINVQLHLTMPYTIGKDGKNLAEK